MTYFAAPGIISYSEKMITIEEIEKIVCKYFGINRRKIHEKTRKRELVTCRKIIMYMALEFNIRSTVGVAEYFNLDHSTVVVHRQSIIAYESIYPDVKQDLDNIRRKIKCRDFD